MTNTPDLINALQFYQLAIPAPKPPEGSFDKDAAGSDGFKELET